MRLYPGGHARKLIAAAACAAASILLFALPGVASAQRNLEVGYADGLFKSPNPAVQGEALDKMKSVNGRIARLGVLWAAVAPKDPTPAFDPKDPGDPQYSWGPIDQRIEAAQAHGFDVMLLVINAPSWAEGKDRPKKAVPGTWKPDPRALGDFATALAKRYSGHYKGLPRVRSYECWGEVNLDRHLAPLWGGKNGKKPIAVDHYRQMLNRFYAAVHRVDRNNRVITGGTSPYGSRPGVANIRPLQFWRPLLCLTGQRHPKPAKHCKKAKFDVLAHNPIDTSGGPNTKALDPNDVATPDLHKLVHLLRVAENAHTTGTKGRHPVWATELWWETNPPDPLKLNPSPKKQARWYVQSLYSLWRQGASVVILLQVIDAPYDGTPGRLADNMQTGLYYANGKPKPSAAAMRFPFLVVPGKGGRGVAWGIAPASGKLVVTQKGRKGPVLRKRVRAHSVFKANVRLRGKGNKLVFRAHVGKSKSPAWTTKR